MGMTPGGGVTGTMLEDCLSPSSPSEATSLCAQGHQDATGSYGSSATSFQNHVSSILVSVPHLNIKQGYDRASTVSGGPHQFPGYYSVLPASACHWSEGFWCRRPETPCPLELSSASSCRSWYVTHGGHLCRDTPLAGCLPVPPLPLPVFPAPPK